MTFRPLPFDFSQGTSWLSKVEDSRSLACSKSPQPSTLVSFGALFVPD
ncbi:MAG: hypothetical protein HC780_04450 [Leptolyngbyaceae cyanobacterium CSU_1_3]|nr:hypothetical protein [Leptolyngbyaceae cyanobacterium CSU_1_3]